VAACDDNLDIIRHGGIDGARKHLAVAGKHQTGRQQIYDRAQFAEIARHQRIGGRYRRVRNADIQRAEREQCVLDVVPR
jgi:hypothetical protein